MDDTNDKIRRNLVALGTLTFLVWYFDVKVTQYPKLLGLAEFNAPSPVKLWGAIIAIHLYFLARFYFDDQTKGLRQKVQNQFNEYGYILVRGHVARNVGRALEAGIKTPILRSNAFYLNFFHDMEAEP